LCNSSGAGDLLCTKQVYILDVVLILQILAGLNPDLSESAIQDIGDDKAIGGEELIYALRKSAGLE